MFKADVKVIESLKGNNLLGEREYSHSYPHSWRSKKPVIYRTTPQWFISMDKNELRKVLEGYRKYKLVTTSSKNRIKKMVNDRPDWCVSRQRSWGVPLTIFIDKKQENLLKIKNNG